MGVWFWCAQRLRALPLGVWRYMTPSGSVSPLWGHGMLFNGEEYLTVPDVGARLGVGKRTLQRWRDVGGGPPYVRFVGRVLYRASDVESWLSARTYVRRSEEVGVR
jgi:hypothetical protein